MTDALGPIFIVGCGRSGTTLLRLMLNRHPRIAIPGETWFFPDIDRLLTELKANSDGEWRDAVLQFISNSATFPELGVSRESIRDMLQCLDLTEWGSVLAAANLAFAEGEGKRRWGDKTPGYVRHLPLLARAFPSAFIVHMIRDARDVAASFFEVPFGPKQPIEAAAYWKQDVLRGRSDGPKFFGERYFEVRYEELATNPEIVMRRVLTHIGEDFDPVVLDQHAAAQEYLVPEHHWHELTTKPVTTARVGRWREKLSDRQVQLVELEAGPLLRDLGYAAHSNTSLASRLEWTLDRATKLWNQVVLDAKVAVYRALKSPVEKPQ